MHYAYNRGGLLQKCRSPARQKCQKSASESADPKRGAEESAEKSASGFVPLSKKGSKPEVAFWHFPRPRSPPSVLLSGQGLCTSVDGVVFAVRLGPLGCADRPFHRFSLSLGDSFGVPGPEWGLLS